MFTVAGSVTSYATPPDRPAFLPGLAGLACGIGRRRLSAPPPWACGRHRLVLAPGPDAR